MLLSVHFICAELVVSTADLLFIFVFWVCTFCLSYFTELVVSTVDFIFFAVLKVNW